MMMKVSFVIAASLFTKSFAEPFTAPGKAAAAKLEEEKKAAQRAEATRILASKPAIPLLKKLGDAGALTALGEAKLLTTAERAKVFSKLEESGAFSAIEKTLPLADKLGVLQIGDDLLNTPSGDLVARGLVLVALGPIYAAAATSGILPSELAEVPALVPALLLTGTTAAGALLIILSSAVAALESPAPAGLGGLSPIPSKRIPLLRNLGEKGLATAIADAGLLSAAERAKVFSGLEEAGAFSTIESTLPIADEFGVLQKLQSVLDQPPGELYTLGAIFLIWGPLTGLLWVGATGLAGAKIVPDGPAVLVPATLLALPAVSGLTSIVLGLVNDALRAKDEPFVFPNLSPAGGLPAPVSTPRKSAPAPAARLSAPAPAPRKSAPAPAPSPPRGKSLNPSGAKYGRLSALPELDRSIVPQHNTFLRTGFNPRMQGSTMPFVRSPRVQAPVVRGLFSQTSADTMSIPAVALIGLLAGSGIAFVFFRFMVATRTTQDYVLF